MLETQIIKKTELNNLIKRTVLEVVQETLADPDFGLEFRESFIKRMRKAMQSHKDGKLIPFEQIKKKYC